MSLTFAEPIEEIKPPHGVTLLELRPRSCRFPLWNDTEGRPQPLTALYCGAEVIDGGPYCLGHRLVCTQKIRESR